MYVGKAEDMFIIGWDTSTNEHTVSITSTNKHAVNAILTNELIAGATSTNEHLVNYNQGGSYIT